MEYRIFLRCLVLGSMFFSAKSQQSCDPDCTGFAPGDLVADPLDCRQYYTCDANGNPSLTSKRCPSPQNFDPSVHECDVVPCSPQCKPCHFTCGLTGPDLIADVVDCSIYYSCDSSGVVGSSMQCPHDQPHFDSNLGSCVFDPSVCCNLGCTPYCKAPSILKSPDPYDCKYFYDCTSDQPTRKPCTATEIFDISLGKCAANAICRAWCPIQESTTAIPTDKVTPSTTMEPPSITTTPSTGDCVDTFQCSASGFFPKCKNCDPRYYYCSSAGQQGLETACGGDFVFNPVPAYANCVPPNLCPYYPPINLLALLQYSDLV